MGDFNEIVHMEERKGETSLSTSSEDFRAWINDIEFVDLMLNYRKYIWFRGQSCNRIDRSLLGRWHKQRFGNIPEKIKKFEDEIKRMLWLAMGSRHAKEMDRNTRYFDNIASVRRRNNRIESLVNNGRLVRNYARIMVVTRDFYRKLYQQKASPNISFRDGLVNRLEMEEAQALEVLPSEEEVEDTTARLPADSNVTWVELSLKFVGAKEINDLTLISMVGCIYKMISKVLTRRMRSVMSGLVGESRSAFVKGRRIHDGALIACETVQWLKLKRKASAIIKLDFQKAYDRVKWISVDIGVEKIGFSRRWSPWNSMLL
ncbi:uncharacterized protein LOC130982753 [Arachis stenosperma]|uniref:uncharacterized protein LOC130982753 n=1 Tax=Arachis stenosperma TaxID=217475 RepID=UPI0025ABAA0A|nr:uncharacterized protein LOC130982753 [Arachis stenosperma]